MQAQRLAYAASRLLKAESGCVLLLPGRELGGPALQLLRVGPGKGRAPLQELTATGGARQGIAATAECWHQPQMPPWVPQERHPPPPPPPLLAALFR